MIDYSHADRSVSDKPWFRTKKSSEGVPSVYSDLICINACPPVTSFLGVPFKLCKRTVVCKKQKSCPLIREEGEVKEQTPTNA